MNHIHLFYDIYVQQMR